MWIASLNSGSNGNCYYIGNHQDAVLIDAGLSCKDIARRMKALGLHMQKVRAVFITHEHADHIKGVDGLAKKYWLPHYFTEKTFAASSVKPDRSLVRFFNSGTIIKVGSLVISSAPSNHDAVDPHSFTVTDGTSTAGVFTDMGSMTDAEKVLFSQCQAVFLEANYDEEMLRNGRYSESLKRRIQSNSGHLSNSQAAALAETFRHKHLAHIFLSHLSKENNRPDLAMAAFGNLHSDIQVHIAPRHGPSSVVCIAAGSSEVTQSSPMKQISLFD